MAYYKTTDHRQTTDRRPPTLRQVLHRQPAHRPTDMCSTDPPTTTTDQRPTDMCSTDPSTTDHRLIDRSSTDPPITDSPTQRPYYNWPTTLWLSNLILIGPILSTTNFNSSFGMATIYFWISKTIHKMIDKKERW